MSESHVKFVEEPTAATMAPVNGVGGLGVVTSSAKPDEDTGVA